MRKAPRVLSLAFLQNLDSDFFKRSNNFFSLSFVLSGFLFLLLYHIFLDAYPAKPSGTRTLYGLRFSYIPGSDERDQNVEEQPVLTECNWIRLGLTTWSERTQILESNPTKSDQKRPTLTECDQIKTMKASKTKSCDDVKPKLIRRQEEWPYPYKTCSNLTKFYVIEPILIKNGPRTTWTKHYQNPLELIPGADWVQKETKVWTYKEYFFILVL